MSNKEIARCLKCTERTIKHHMTNIMLKLNVRNRVQAAMMAVQMNAQTRSDIPTPLSQREQARHGQEQSQAEGDAGKYVSEHEDWLLRREFAARKNGRSINGSQTPAYPAGDVTR
jgi:predicted transcriptional regulator